MDLTNFIIYTISNIMMSIGVIYSYAKISELKIEINLKCILVILISSICLTLNNYYNVTTFRILVACILTLVTTKIVFKQNIKITFIKVVIITCISILIEFISLPLINLYINNIKSLNNNLILKIIYSVINNLILITCISNIRIRRFIKKLGIVINNFLNFYTISIILICFINIIITFLSYNTQNIQLIIVVIISLVLLFICLKVIINDKYNNALLIEKNKILKDEHKAYANTIDECRELKHNLKNELYSTKAKLPKNEQNMINSIITKYNSNYEWINTLNEIPEGLQGLIYLKINEAKTKKITIYLNTKSSLKTPENDYLDLSIILGILLDNAIDASVTAKSKSIVINIREDRSILNIEIINKFKNSINTDEIGQKNYSTKEYKSGLGLNYIKKIKKSNIKVDFKITNDLFITTLEYYNKK